MNCTNQRQIKYYISQRIFFLNSIFDGAPTLKLAQFFSSRLRLYLAVFLQATSPSSPQQEKGEHKFSIQGQPILSPSSFAFVVLLFSIPHGRHFHFLPSLFSPLFLSFPPTLRLAHAHHVLYCYMLAAIQVLEKKFETNDRSF